MNMIKKEQESAFEQSLKSNDTEERIDIWFYRPIGFRIAKVCAKLGVTPNAVTIISIFFGVAAGILFYYQDIRINIIGMLLLMFANSLDSADGQLARMTDNKSRFGRILDGFAGDFWFASIHIALCLRLMDQGWSIWIWVPGILAGIAHVFQSAMADYYRNVHLYFIKGESGSELDNSKDLSIEFEKLSWTKDTFQKFVLHGYMGYTRMQENLSPKLQKLLQLIKAKFPNMLPLELIQDFREMNKPLMKYTNIVQFNTRVIFLFLWLFMDQVWLYFVFDILVLTPILIYMVLRQEKVSNYFLYSIELEDKYGQSR
ncbi:MAG: CDP-alcohol phosphatidyltransferase family protein [Sphingobacterium sp.]|nr:CDP-alcohol phosphatidyltransferase family protein [Sphingobacterium sp.]